MLESRFLALKVGDYVLLCCFNFFLFHLCVSVNQYAAGVSLVYQQKQATPPEGKSKLPPRLQRQKLLTNPSGACFEVDKAYTNQQF